MFLGGLLQRGRQGGFVRLVVARLAAIRAVDWER
jgi:hypothetical protein